MLVWLLPAVPPVIPPVTTGAGQLYTVPGGTAPFVPSTGVASKADPLQMVLVMLFISGTGFTLTVTVNVLPVHGPAGEAGVMV